MMFPIRDYNYSIPEGEHPGAFLKERKNHFHEGIDLYTKVNSEVVSMNDGVVFKIINFTGEAVGSPWWNSTQAIIIKTKIGYLLYGEIIVGTNLSEGDSVSEGQLLGKVTPVLRRRKKEGNPTSMLHFEWYSEYINPIELINDKRNRNTSDDFFKEVEKKGLLDPTQLLKNALKETVKENVLLMICGSISAYKSVDLARGFLLSGCNVKVILSKGAKSFVQKDVFSYLNIECYSHEDDFVNKGVLHIELARWASRVIIAPASVNTISRIASGEASDLLTSVFISLKKDVVKQFLPVMNPEMLNQVVTRKNIKSLVEDYNAIELPSDTGVLACGEYGEGKLPSTSDIVYLSSLMTGKCKEVEVLITAGATIAPIDTIRYVTNSAKGGTGILLAEKYLKEGYSVSIVCGTNSLKKFDILSKHPRCKLKRVQTTNDLFNFVKEQEFDIYISTMAVSDLEFDVSSKKLKKDSLNVLNTKKSKDVLSYVVNNNLDNDKIIIGFAAESELTEDVLSEKLSRKPVNILVANEADGGFVSGIKKGFGKSNGKYILLNNRGNEHYQCSKKDICDKIFSLVRELYVGM